MDTFALSVTIFPTDGGAPYAARGVWRYQDTDVMLDDGTLLSSTTITLGIRLSEYPAVPLRGYGVQIYRPAWAKPNAFDVQNYVIDMVRPDGQGGASLVLKAKQPVPITG